MAHKSEYAEAGVDPSKIGVTKNIMRDMGRKTLHFPEVHGVFVESGAHGASFEYRHGGRHRWTKTTEGLGNKNWIAEWLYQNDPAGGTRYSGIGIDTMLMAANDVGADGSRPVVYTDEIAAGDSEWFEDERRARDLADSFYAGCCKLRVALPAGESPALRYLIKAELPVKSAPSLSGCMTSLIAPWERRVPGVIKAGYSIVGAPASGLHANGISAVIKRGLTLPDQFLTRLPNGKTYGDEALIPTRSYVSLVQALLNARVEVGCWLPGTGGGVSKPTVYPEPFTFRIHSWVQEVPLLFQYLRELGMSMQDLLTTFNWGIGYYGFLPPQEVAPAIDAAAAVGLKLLEIGRVEEGERQVIFEPENIVLPPFGD